MELLKKIWKDPVWSKVISAAILATFAVIWTIIDLESLIIILRAIWNVIIAFFSIQLPLWIFIVFLVLVTLSILVFRKWTNKKKPFLGYTEDVFDDLKCTWSYDIRGNITDLKVFCPNCNTIMQGIKEAYNAEPHKWRCPKKCPNNNYENYYYLPIWDIRTFIESNIENDAYPKNRK